MNKFMALVSAGLAASLAAAPAGAQEAGESFARVSVARTKLVDKGTIWVNGVEDPSADYETRATYHGMLTGGYFVFDSIALEGSITTPATTNNIPAGSLAGTPNLGDDEFVTVSGGASFHPFRGRVSPYVGGGYVHQFTTQERDGLAVNLNIPNSGGPYIQGGIDFRMSDTWGLFAEVRKAWYHSNASGLLPLDATFTNFAEVTAKAELDPFTIRLGVTANFNRRSDWRGSEITTDTTKWTLRGGLTSLRLRDRLDLTVGGAPFPGASKSTFEHETLTVQIGRFLTPNIAVNATLGIPPKVDIYGAGSIGALPKLGEVTYGPTALTLQYHPTRSGRVRPYVGAGLSYMIVFDSDDGAFEDLDCENDLGPAVEAGVDFMVSQRTAIFADVKKAWLRTTATGTFAGAPVVGESKLDPWAFTGGIAIHF